MATGTTVINHEENNSDERCGKKYFSITKRTTILLDLQEMYIFEPSELIYFALFLGGQIITVSVSNISRFRNCEIRTSIINLSCFIGFTIYLISLK